MVQRQKKRSITSSTSTAYGSSGGSLAKKVRTAYLDLMDESSNKTVDPLACIPLTKIRRLSKCGVMKLKRLMGGEKLGDKPGIFASSDTPVVVPLTGSMTHYLQEHFEGLKYKSSEIEEKIKERDTWYGIIDGMHRHQAITQLMEERPEEWVDFKWYVTILNGGHSLHEYKQLARLQNLKNSDEYYIKPTLYDIFKGLKEEEVKLRKERGKEPSGTDIAKAFEGSTYLSMSSIKQAATTVKRLSMVVVETLGEIMNQEIPEKSTAVYGIDADNYKQCTPEQLQTRLDCRVYRNSFHLTSLKSSTAFMREGEGEHLEDGITNQCNTLHRCKFVSAGNGYKPVQPDAVTNQLGLSKYARIEEEKFFLFHEDTSWPIEMEKVKTSLLRDISLNTEITENKGNDYTLLPFILDRYRALYPAVSGIKETKFKALSSDHYGAQQETPPTQCDAASNTNNNNDQNINNSDSIEVSHAPQLVIPTPEEIEENILQENRISLYDMKWQDYAKSIFSEDDSLYDLIITDPPYNLPANPSRTGNGFKDFISDDEIRAFSQFCNRSVKTGSYVILFTSIQLFPRWVESFKESQFKVMQYPFVVMKDHNAMQQRQKVDFPQNCCEFLMLAKSAGAHPSGFMPDFREIYNNVCNSSKKAFAGVSQLPVTKFKILNKPSKEPLRVEEKNVDFLIELMSLFSPLNGRILDPFAGTLTAGIAAHRSRRTAVCIEKDSHCFKLSRDRLLRLLKPMEQTERTVQVPTLSQTTRVTTESSQHVSLLDNLLSISQNENGCASETVNETVAASQSENSFHTANEQSTALNMLAGCVESNMKEINTDQPPSRM